MEWAYNVTVAEGNIPDIQPTAPMDTGGYSSARADLMTLEADRSSAAKEGWATEAARNSAATVMVTVTVTVAATQPRLQTTSRQSGKHITSYCYGGAVPSSGASQVGRAASCKSLEDAGSGPIIASGSILPSRQASNLRTRATMAVT